VSNEKETPCDEMLMIRGKVKGKWRMKNLSNRIDSKITMERK
jgi:hypothetical protein